MVLLIHRIHRSPCITPTQKYQIQVTSSLQFTNILIIAYCNCKQIDKMENVTEYIPKAAQLNFYLKVLKEAKKTPEFATWPKKQVSSLRTFMYSLKYK